MKQKTIEWKREEGELDLQSTINRWIGKGYIVHQVIVTSKNEKAEPTTAILLMHPNICK